MSDEVVRPKTELEDPANQTLGGGGHTGGGAVVSPPDGGGQQAFEIANQRVYGIPTVFHFWTPRETSRQYAIDAEARIEHILGNPPISNAEELHTRIADNNWEGDSYGILPLIFRFGASYIHHGWVAINYSDPTHQHDRAMVFARRFQELNDKP